jgi:predicted RNA-binding protein Jag
MKSLIEAAASVLKAIEKGWQRAGCPQEFTVKILEEGETNFLGMVRKPAKVALFFVDGKDSTSLPLPQPQAPQKKSFDNAQHNKPKPREVVEENKKLQPKYQIDEHIEQKEHKNRSLNTQQQRPPRDTRPRAPMPPRDVPTRDLAKKDAPNAAPTNNKHIPDNNNNKQAAEHRIPKEQKTTVSTLYRSSHRKSHVDDSNKTTDASSIISNSGKDTNQSSSGNKEQ